MPFGFSRLFLTLFPVTGSKDENFCQSCRMSFEENGSLAGNSIFLVYLVEFLKPIGAYG